jgi:KaiC/GvpD/RAD55 family RecA-like ATPase
MQNLGDFNLCPNEAETQTSVKTGSSVLEGILEGTLPNASSIALIGAPGTGTSTVAIQFIVNALAKGENVIFALLDYVPHFADRYFKSFRFDTEPFIADGRLRIIDAYGLLRRYMGISTMEDIEDLRPIEFSELSELFQKELMSKLLDKENEPSSMVVDSFTSIAPFIEVHPVYEIMAENFARMRKGGHSSLIVAHEGVLEGNFVQVLTRFVDGVIKLKMEWSAHGFARELFIEKLRSTNVERPTMDFAITNHGIVLHDNGGFQRRTGASRDLQRTKTSQAEHIVSSSDGRVSTGIRKLDAILGGGFPRGMFICVEGDVGVGTSTFCAQFAWSRLLAGGKVAYFCVDETPDTVTEHFRSFGWDLTPYIEKRSIILSDAYNLFRAGRTAALKGAKQADVIRKMISQFMKEENAKMNTGLAGKLPLVGVIDSFTTMAPYLDLKTAYVLAHIIADNARTEDEIYLSVVRSSTVEANLLYACLGTADGIVKLENTWTKGKQGPSSERRLVRKMRIEKMAFTPIPPSALEYEISSKGMKLKDSG